MVNQTNRVLQSSIAPGITLFGIAGTTQYVVVTPGSEYSFTSEEAAQGFAQELAKNQNIYKTATMDKASDTAVSESSNMFPVVPPKKRRLFRIGGL